MFGIVPLCALMLLLAFWSQPASADVSATLTSKVLSRYVLVNGADVYRKPVVQSELLLLLPKGFYADLFWSTGMNTQFSHDLDDEVDWTVGWSGNVGKGVVLDFGVTYFDLRSLWSTKGPVGDFIQPFAQAEKTFSLSESQSLTPYLRLEVLFPTHADIRTGSYVHLGVRHVWTVSDVLALNQKLFLVGDSGAAGFDAVVIGHYQAGLDWRMAKKLTLTLPTLKFSSPLSHVSDGRQGEFVYGLGMSLAF